MISDSVKTEPSSLPTPSSYQDHTPRRVTVWVGLLKNGGSAMCMGCAGIATLSNDGKAPDTTETIVYFGVFALWIVVMTHFKKKWFVKPDANST